MIGTAGWAIPRVEQVHFPGDSSHLVRYAARFPVTEINSSFHRTHRRTTYLRWRDAVPAAFRFSAKVPKLITHTHRLVGTSALVKSFLEEIGALEEKLGCLLVQLPPSFGFDAEVTHRFFDELQSLTALPIACEPRHVSWFSEEADTVLAKHKIARVAADPARVPAAATPGGWRGLSYYRLHGSPKIYYSAYTPEFISQLADDIDQELGARREVWCIFDNTTLGAATRNALDLSIELEKKGK